MAGQPLRHGRVGLSDWTGLLCQAKIEQLDPLLGDENVRRLQVAMGDAFAMGGIERVENLSGIFNRSFERQRPFERSAFDQMWLFAVDVGDGLTEDDCRAISNFRRLGRGLMVTRDHMDLGCSICSIEGVGAAHLFHSKNVDPNFPLERDDPYTTNISWPNFHSGANGDYQIIQVTGSIHPVLSNPSSPTGAIRHLPSHPHEGAVSAPVDSDARVIASGTSKATGRSFNIAVAFESAAGRGRAIAQSTFHHFADYNWDTRLGAPSFVSEPPGDAIMREPAAMVDTHRYVRNVAL